MNDFFQNFTKNMFTNDKSENWDNTQKMQNNFKLASNVGKHLLEHSNKMLAHQLDVASKFAHNVLEMCENVIHSKNPQEINDHHQDFSKKQFNNLLHISEETMEMQQEACNQLNKIINPTANSPKPATAAKSN